MPARRLFAKFGWTDEDIDLAADKPLDDDEWREIVEQMVDRILVKTNHVGVEWRDGYRPLLKLA